MGALLVAIDANVLIAAMLSSRGASRRLLRLASLGIFRPVITSEILAEVDRNCRAGIAGRIISDAEIQAFHQAIGPLLEQENLASNPIGRAASEHAPLVNVDNRAIIQPHPGDSGHPRGEKKRTEVINGSHALMKDMGDAHVLAAAIRHRCDYICTGNTADFPDGFEMAGLRVISSGGLLELLLSKGDEEVLPFGVAGSYEGTNQPQP
jgi:predicted nucleic acid-binding protein